MIHARFALILGMVFLALGCSGSSAAGGPDARADRPLDASAELQVALDSPVSEADTLALDVLPQDVSVDTPRVDAPQDGGGGRPNVLARLLCHTDVDCDDGIACTRDSCVPAMGTSWRCTYEPLPSRCGMGQTCDPRAGCRVGRVCATDADCADTDPCTHGESCALDVHVCVYPFVLDSDADGYAPRVCGGNDCDDANDLVHPGAQEYCNNQDDDCDGIVDNGARCDPGQVCRMGSCVCQTTCPSGCSDPMTDVRNCGACGHACPTGATCAGGRCTCPITSSDVCDGACTSLQRDQANCGTCGHACFSLPDLFGAALCQAGHCRCNERATTCMVRGEAFCTDLMRDPQNCGACGHVCPTTPNGVAVCVAGACQIRCNEDFFLRDGACLGHACPGFRGECDPINNLGCAAGERCAFFEWDLMDRGQYICRTLPSGGATEGSACDRTTGCVAELLCVINPRADYGTCYRPCCGATDSRCGAGRCGSTLGGPYLAPQGQFCSAP